MIYFVVDVEADGPTPGKYSMVEFGCVAVDADTHKTVGTFSRLLKPLPDASYSDAALRAVGRTHQETIDHGRDPLSAMEDFRDWIERIASDHRRWMVADNAGFDFMFITWYFHEFLGESPLGWSCLSLTSFVKGYERDMRSTVHKYRKTPHTHKGLADAQGNAEVLVHFLKEMEREGRAGA